MPLKRKKKLFSFYMKNFIDFNSRRAPNFQFLISNICYYNYELYVCPEFT